MTSSLSCVLFNFIIIIAFKTPNTLKNALCWANTLKKFIVFLGSALISLWPSVRNFYSGKKKLIEGPDFTAHDVFSESLCFFVNDVSALPS